MELNNTDIENINRLVEALRPTAIPEGVLLVLEAVLLQAPQAVNFNYGNTWDPGQEVRLGRGLFVWSSFCMIYNEIAAGGEPYGIKLNYRPTVREIHASDMCSWVEEIAQHQV